MKTILFFALALVWSSGVLAQEVAGDRQQIQETNPGKDLSVPTTIDFQGRLHDNGEVPLNGILSITFTLYDAVTGGVPLWTESSDVTFTNGLFHVTLGETVPLEPALFDGAERYLGILIAGDNELNPRIRFASVPYALHAGSNSDMQWEQSGDNIFNKNSGNVGIGSASPTTKLLVMGSGSSPSIPSSSSNGILRLGICQHAGLNIGKIGTEPWSTWFQAGWNGITTDPISLQPLGGTIGIGTISPETKLHVTGEDSLRVIFSAAEGANSRSSGIMLRSTFGDDVPDHMPRNLALIKAHFDGGGWATAGLAFHVAGNDCITDEGADPCERMRITDGGNVGIGTTTPSALLQVHGTGIGEGNVLFVGETKNEPGNPPAQGGGTRMMWYPDKAAFRAGIIIPTLGSTFWDKDSIGNGSVAFGMNTKAKGVLSTAFGFLTAATGHSSTALGYMTTASGNYSTAFGSNSKATGSSSLAAGGLASGESSFSAGKVTKAMGTASTAFGNHTIASSTSEVVIGQYNETYTPAGGTNNWEGADRLFVIGNGTEELFRKNALTVLKNGNAGIGTNEPLARLHIHNETANGNGLYVNTFFSNTGRIIDGRSSGQTRFCVISNGNVGIGTDNPTYPLAVNGTIRSKKVIVDSGWADFVFDDEYHLRPLNEVESFIKEYNRLPEIPSAKDVEENGVSLGEISASLLQKIEELTLYTIEQQKIIDELLKQHKELMIRVTEIEKK